jgi:hypothetical protein
MVLLDNVVEVFNLAHKDRYVAAGVDGIDHRLVGRALVHRDLVWIAVRSHSLAKEALRRGLVPLRRQQEVDGFGVLVDGAVEVFPDALDFDVGLIHAPAAADQALVFTAIFSMSGRKRIAQRLIDEWSTDTPRSSIISSRCR